MTLVRETFALNILTIILVQHQRHEPVKGKEAVTQISSRSFPHNSNDVLSAETPEQSGGFSGFHVSRACLQGPSVLTLYMNSHIT